MQVDQRGGISDGERADIDSVPPTTPVFSFAFLSRSISIRGAITRVLRNWIVFAAFVLLFFVIGIYQAHMIGPRYIASMDIQPAEIGMSSGSGGAAGAVGGLLGSLAGGGTDGASIPEFVQFQAALSSEGVARDLDKRTGMLCRIYKGRCDPVTHQWKRAGGTRAYVNGLLALLQGLPDPNGPATIADLAGYITGAVQITKQRTGIITLSYESSDPHLATEFLFELWYSTNSYLKNQDRQLRRDYLAYLSQRIEETTSLAQREAIQNLLLEEERRLMQTAADVPYAADILDGPRVAPSNRVIKTLVVYLFMGLLLGVFAAYFADTIASFLARAIRRT